MSHTVHRLHMASFKLAGEFNPPTFEDARADVYAYLIITAGGAPILVDTGIGEGNEVIDRRFEPERTPVVDELARFQLHLRDVRTIVNSHLHFDHCGNNRLFENAEIFIQQDELAIAREMQTRYTVPWWFDYENARIQVVSGDLEICAGVTLLSTPGHTPGHQSVLVETDSGVVVVAAQAAFRAAEFDRGGDAAVQAHDGLSNSYSASIVRLKSSGARAFYFSHDREAAGHG